MNVSVTFKVPEGYERKFVDAIRDSRGPLTVVTPVISSSILGCDECHHYGMDLCRHHGIMHDKETD
jgi:hypothetical protein